MAERRYLKPNEALALDPRCLHQDVERGAFFWLWGDPPKDNERCGSVVTVHVRGELDHHESYFGESYESILCRLQDAVAGNDVVEAYAREHRWDEDYQPAAAVPPSHIVMCIDSPGGVVAGLNECVRAIRKIRTESKIPIIAYVNEMAASAAFALACACDKIYCPPSAIIGSIGVISTMVSQAAKNKKDGYDVRLITSGARKADGHAHAPITSAAVAAERVRVDQLAGAFFALASARRHISIAKVKSFEANIFLGHDAVKRSLADGIIGYRELVTTLSQRAEKAKKNVPSAGGNQTDRRESGLTESKKTHTTKAQGKPMDLDELITKYEARLKSAISAGATDRIAKFATALEAAKKAKSEYEDEEEEEEDEDEDEAKAAKAGAAAADRMLAARSQPSAAKKAKKAAKDDEEDEKAKSGKSEEEEAKAVLAKVREITGLSGHAAIGALQSLQSVVKDVAAIKANAAATEKASAIKEATGKYVMKHEVPWLESQPLATVKGFIEHRRKTGAIVNTEEGDLVKPAAPDGAGATLPKDVMQIVDEAVAAFPGDKEKYRATLVKNLSDNKALNGATERY